MNQLVTGIWNHPPSRDPGEARVGLRLTVGETGDPPKPSYTFEAIVGQSVAELAPTSDAQRAIEDRVIVAPTGLVTYVSARIPAAVRSGRLHQPTMEALTTFALKQRLIREPWLMEYVEPTARKPEAVEVAHVIPARVTIRTIHNRPFSRARLSHIVAAGMRLALRQALAESDHQS